MATWKKVIYLESMAYNKPLTGTRKNVDHMKQQSTIKKKLGYYTEMYRSEKAFMRDPATVNCRIYVGNLDETATPENLEEHFKSHGNIVGVVVQRGFGFVQFENESSAQEAIKNEHGSMFQGKRLNVRPAFDNKSKIANTVDEPVGNTHIGDGPLRKMPRRGPPIRGGRGGLGLERDMSPHLEEREYSYYRDTRTDIQPYFGNRDDNYSSTSTYLPPVLDRTPVPDRNDCEIIVVAKTLTEYAEYIEQRLKSIGLTVDLLFPNEDVPIGRVLANISSRGCLYAILVMPQNEEHRSLTLNILHGIPQEHRNMPVDDAVTLIARNFDAYMRGEKSGPSAISHNSAMYPQTDRHPEAIQIMVNLLADNRLLTTLQYDRLIKYLQEKRELQYKKEVGDGADLDADENSKQTELQNRILSILNKTNSGNASPAITPAITPTASAPPILLNDPSVQKALDSLMQVEKNKASKMVCNRNL